MEHALEQLLELSAMLVESRDPETLLEKIVKSGIELLGAERGYIYMREVPEDPVELYFGLTNEGQVITAKEARTSLSVINQVDQTGKEVAIMDTESGEPISLSESIMSFSLRSILCTPLIHADAKLGVLYFDSKFKRTNFSNEHLRLLKSFAALGGAALANARDYQSLERLKQELMLEVEQRRQAEVALRKANRELERLIAERTEALKLKTEDLEHQSTALLAGDRKLEEVWESRELTAKRVTSIYHDYLVPLRDNLESLQAATSDDVKEGIIALERRVRQALDVLKPLQEHHNSEEAMKSKRVLLAEAERKQQILVKMALGGTGVTLDVASDFEKGRTLLDEHYYDVIIAEAQMIELLEFAHKINPSTPLVLAASEKAAFYVEKLNAFPYITTVISRHHGDPAFSTKNISVTIKKLVSRDIFGLEKYLSWGVDIQERTVESSYERHVLINEMEEYFRRMGVRTQILTRCTEAADELLMNGIYDAPVDENRKPKYNHMTRLTPVRLEPKERCVFRYASDGLWLAISVADPFGSLNRETILDYLAACYRGRFENERAGKGGAGRGLFMMVERTDLLIFNVELGVRTEVIALINIRKHYQKLDVPSSFHLFYLLPNER